MREDLVDRVLVEQPLIDSLRFDAIRDFSVLAPLLRVPFLFLSFGEIVVFVPFPLELQRHCDRFHRNEKAVLHRVFQRVSICRHSFFEIEKRIGVAIDFVLRRGSQPDQIGIEVFEDGAVFLINGTVRFVDDDQIEVARTKSFLPVFGLIDQTHHGWIGGDVDTAFLVLLRHEIDGR